jgi:UDP-N-acetylmuramate--alanine ligase
METLSGIEHELLTFGFEEKTCDGSHPMHVRGVNVHAGGRTPSMDVMYDGEQVCKITLKTPGIHNLKNALAAAAACLSIGIAPKAIEEGLYAYTGVGRRFEYKGSYNGADVYDDYAHHPCELHALIDTVEALNAYKRIILAFQPHTYTRTKALFSDFVEELKRPDVVLLAEIYAARENNDGEMTSTILANAVPGAQCISDFDKLTDAVSAIAQEGDIILTVGAGDIYKVGEALILS